VTKTSFQKLVEEMRRRRVFRVATLYVVSIWPILQIIDILSPTLNISDGTMRSLLFYFVLGFPIAIVFAWLYNLTPKGLVKNTGNEDVAQERMFGNRLEIAVIVVCISFAGVLFTFQDDLFEMTQGDDAPTNALAQQAQQYESIAVLPFVPFSDDRQDEYFADGLAEELLNVLAKIQSLQVAARTSSFAYKGVTYNIQKIGRELGVDVILEGSVRRNDVDNTVRVTAQLIDVRTGNHLWSETYDRKFEDIFRIQDDITEAVVGELRITLLGEEKELLMAHETATPEAIIAHSKGREELAKRTGSAIRLAKEYFEQAVASDPNYATAYASLAEANVLLVQYDNADKETQHALAQEAVDKALAIDEDLGLAWAAQGLVLMGQEDKREEAKAVLEKAIKLNPSYAMAYMWYASYQDSFEETTAMFEKAFTLDPMSPVAGYNYANNLIMKGRDVEAMDVFSNMVDADPFYPNSYVLVSMINSYNGRYDHAIENLKKSYDLGDYSKSGIYLAEMYTELGDVERARHWLEQTPKNKDYERSYMWFDIQHMVIENNWAGTEEALKKLADPAADAKEYEQYDAIVANYFLEDYPKVIRAFEVVEPEMEYSYKWLIKSRGLSHLVYAAHAYNETEQTEKALELIDQIRLMHKEYDDKGFRKMANHWYWMGLVDVIEGNNDLAIISLQRAVDAGWLSKWQIENEPILRDLLNKPEFSEVRQSLNARLAIIKEQLAYMDKTASL